MFFHFIFDTVEATAAATIPLGAETFFSGLTALLTSSAVVVSFLPDFLAPFPAVDDCISFFSMC